jgi:protein-tyrosine phosphatase
MSKKHKKKKQRKDAALKENQGVTVPVDYMEFTAAPAMNTREFSDKTPGPVVDYSAEPVSASKKPYVYTSCAKSHPALNLGNGLSIYGGAAHSPVVGDADIYVSLDQGHNKDSKAQPWNGGRQFIYFPINDMGAPSDAAEFKKMITWLAAQITAGRKAHVGCIGGHGRTGTLFAALVKEMTGNVNAIQYVREQYCEKAVESQSQVDFLAKHYGVAKVKATKSYEPYSTGSSKKSFYDRYSDLGYEKNSDEMWERYASGGGKAKAKELLGEGGLAYKKDSDVAVIDPKPDAGNVWGIDPSDPSGIGPEAAEAPAIGEVIGID